MVKWQSCFRGLAVVSGVSAWLVGCGGGGGIVRDSFSGGADGLATIREESEGAVPRAATPPTVNVNSSPPGAKIFLNNRDTGKITPATLTVSVGRVTIKLTKNGYKNFSQTFTAKAGKTYKVTATLVASGTVAIADYVPYCVGSQWHYQDPKDPSGFSSTLTVAQQVTINGKPAMKITEDEDNADYFWADTTTGLWYFGHDDLKNNLQVRLANPLHVPSQVTIGQTYSGSSMVRVNSLPVGTLTWKVTVEGREGITVPAGVLSDCLVMKMQIDAPVVPTSGPLNELVRVWYAAGVGVARELDLTQNTEVSLDWAKVCGQTFGNAP